MKAAKIIGLVLVLALGGCRTTRMEDYKQDTTPDHQGEHWIGARRTSNMERMGR